MKTFPYKGRQLCSSRLLSNKFSLELFYFLFISFLGFCALQSLNVRTTTFTPRKLDLFFTTVSAATVSSISTVEIEVFSNTQLVILTVLMFIGGEVFTSMIQHFVLNASPKDVNKTDPSKCNHDTQCGFLDKIALNDINIVVFEESKVENFGIETVSSTNDIYMEDLKYKSFKFLGIVVVFYLILIQFLGIISVLIYLSLISSAKSILTNKGLNPLTFSIFTVVSTFSNCGFVPTNENMLIFIKNSGLLLILIPQALFGNTLYPPVLRFSIWATGKLLSKKSETDYLLNNSKGIGYPHLLSNQLQSSFLLMTVLVFIAVQYILFSSMEWNSGSLSGLNTYQKLVGILFQTVSSRYSGESIVDLSTISGAVLVLFVLMMYLPPYTSFLPVVEESSEQGRGKTITIMEKLILSQQTYLVIFIILVCITERTQMVDDPLNFSVLNIVVEVISAYGNVGFSTGYNCDRRLKREGDCQNKWYGFSGKWSDEGKVVLIAVMIFGRLKKFNMNGGKAWKAL